MSRDVVRCRPRRGPAPAPAWTLLLPLLLAQACGSGGSGAGGPDAGPADGDDPSDGAGDASAPGDGAVAATVIRYDYRFDPRTGQASATLTFEIAAGGAGCAAVASQLPLRNLAAGGVPGLRAEQRGTAVSVCGTFPAAGTFTLDAEATVPAKAEPTTGIGFSRRTDGLGRVFAYLLGWVESCPLFGPCDPSPARLAHFTFDVRHDPGDVVLCPGRRQSPGGGQTRCELLDTGAPSYASFAVASSPLWRRAPLVTAAGVNVVTYEIPEGRVRAALAPQAVGAYLEWLTGLLGPYPYGDELRIAVAPVAWMGMEHPANIVVAESLPDIPNLYRNVPLHTVLHEVVHQWAGDRTTIASALDFGWKEAIAEYLAYVFEDEQRPAGEAAATRAVWHGTGLGAPYPLRPLAPPPDLTLAQWSAGSYGTGPMTLFLQLEPWLGRAALLEGVRRFLAEPGARSVDELRAALEAASGRRLGDYFQGWVFGNARAEWPLLAVETTQAVDETTVTVMQTHAAGIVFPCVVEVEVRGATRTARALVDFGLEPAAATASTRIAFPEPVTGTRIDPDKRLLAWHALTIAGPEPAPALWHPSPIE